MLKHYTIAAILSLEQVEQVTPILTTEGKDMVIERAYMHVKRIGKNGENPNSK